MSVYKFKCNNCGNIQYECMPISEYEKLDYNKLFCDKCKKNNLSRTFSSDIPVKYETSGFYNTDNTEKGDKK